MYLVHSGDDDPIWSTHIHTESTSVARCLRWAIAFFVPADVPFGDHMTITMVNWKEKQQQPDWGNIGFPICYFCSKWKWMRLVMKIGKPSSKPSTKLPTNNNGLHWLPIHFPTSYFPYWITTGQPICSSLCRTCCSFSEASRGWTFRKKSWGRCVHRRMAWSGSSFNWVCIHI